MRLADRYRLEEETGRGRMATVWRGWDELLSRPVAVKVVRTQLLSDPGFCTRFLEEARAASRLSHPSIVAVTDFGEATIAGGKAVPFLVMEQLRGRDLAARMAEGPLPWREAVKIAARTAGAVAYAHSAGMAHGGLTPANVFLTSEGVKVLDFGTAQTPKSSTADDVGALGRLLTDMMGGALPSGVPPAVADICSRCLSPKPSARPDAAEVAAKLTAVRDEVQVAGRVASRPPAHAAAPAAAAPTEGVPKQLVGGIAAVGALTLALVLALVLKPGPAGSPAAAPPANAGVAKSTQPPTLGATKQPTKSQSPTATTTPTPTPSRTAATETPSPTASPGSPRPPRTTRPGPDQPPADATEMLEDAEDSVREGMYRREIRFDAGVDLINNIGNLRRDLEAGREVDLRDRIGQIRERLYTRVRERAIERRRAQQIDAILSQVRP